MNEEQKKKRKRVRDRRLLIVIFAVIICAGVGVGSLAFYENEDDNTAWLQKELDSADGVVEITDTIIITKPVTVTGDVTLTGSGTILYKPKTYEKLKLENYRIRDDECEATKFVDLSERDALFVVESGASLTVSDQVTVNANGKAIAVKVEDQGSVEVTGSASIKNSLGANIYSDGAVVISGGKVEAEEGYNVVSNDTISVTGGEVTGSGERLMNILAKGTVEISGGSVSDAQGSNIYLLDGTLSVTGGTITGAAKDNLFVEAGEVSVTDGTITKGTHGLHNLGSAVVTGGSFVNNNNQLYNEGSLKTQNMTYGNSLANNIVNYGKSADMTMTDVIIESATSHGVYNVRGAKLTVTNFTVKSALAKGIHNGGGFVTGTNVTIVRAGGAGVGNDIEKGWTEEGDITISGLQVLKASNHTLYNAAGTMTINDAELGLIENNSIQISGGSMTLNNVDIKGTTGTGTYHAIYIQGGSVTANNLNIEKSVARAIQNRGGSFTGTKVTISNVAGTGIGNMVGSDGVTNGDITINGLTMSKVEGYSVQNSDEGTITLKNATIDIADRSAIKVENGKVNLENVKITGSGNAEEAASSYGGIVIAGGAVTVKNVTIKDMLARGVSIEEGSISGTTFLVDGIPGTGIYSANGNIKLSEVTCQNVTGYNLQVKGGSCVINGGTFNAPVKASSICTAGGDTTLKNVVVNGSSKVIKEDGTTTLYTGLELKDGTVNLQNVTVSDTYGRGFNNVGATVTAKNLTITGVKEATGFYNSGTTTVDGLTLSGTQIGYNVDNKGTLTLKNADIDISNTININLQKKSTTTLENVVVEGTTESFGVYVRENASLSFDGLTIKNTTSRGLTNGYSSKKVKGGTITGKNLVLLNTTTTSFANDDGTASIDGLYIQGANANTVSVVTGSVTIKNASIGITNDTSVVLYDGTLKIYDSEILGTTKGNGITQNAGNVYLKNVTFDNVYARSLNLNKGELTGENVIIKKGGSAATVINVASDASVNLDGLTVEDATAYAINNAGTVTIKNGVFTNGSNSVINNQKTGTANLSDFTITISKKIPILNAGTMTLGDGTIDCAGYDALSITAGNLTLSGILNVNTEKYVITLKTAGKLKIGEEGGVISDSSLYLSKGAAIQVTGEKIGTTSLTPIYLASESSELGTVLVKTSSEEIGKQLAYSGVFKHATNSLDVDGANVVVGTVREYNDEQILTAATYEELKKIIDSAENEDNYRIVLTDHITTTDTLEIGTNGRVKITLTDDGKGYTLTRGDITKAMFKVDLGSTLDLDGTLTVDGASSSSVKAGETMILNEGVTTIESGATVKGGYKSSGAATVVTKTNGSAGAIESAGTLNIYGTVTTSGSGNGNAISTHAGVINLEGAHLNKNAGRALRVMEGTGVITKSEVNNNSGASGGGGILIDAADVTITDSDISGNVSSGSGGGIQTTSTSAVLRMTGCTITNNTSKTTGAGIRIDQAPKEAVFENCVFQGNKGTHGGGAWIKTGSTVTFKGCTFKKNTSSGTNIQGAAIYMDNTGVTVTVENCIIEDNTTSQCGGGIRVGNGDTLKLEGTTTIKNNVGTLGTQIWVNDAAATIYWGSEVVMDVDDLDRTTDTKGMIGLNAAGVNIVLTGEMNASNNISLKGNSKLAIGNTIFKGYDETNAEAQINSWIAKAAQQIVVTNPADAKVGENGKLIAK